MFNSLVSFFNKHLSIIELKEEEAKNQLIQNLEQSLSFFDTHNAISLLEKYLGLFSNEEIKRLINAGYENSQVSSILMDEDLKNFYCTLMDRNINDPLSPQILSDFEII